MKSLVIGDADTPFDRKQVRRRIKRFLRWILGAFLIISGISHLLLTANDDVMLMPSRWSLALVYLSGAFEIMLGSMLLSRRLQVTAAWGTIALLLIVGLAHLHMALQSDPEIDGWEAWARFSLQPLLIIWAFWYTRVERRRRRSSSGGGVPGTYPAAPARAKSFVAVAREPAFGTGTASYVPAQVDIRSAADDGAACARMMAPSVAVRTKKAAGRVRKKAGQERMRARS